MTQYLTEILKLSVPERMLIVQAIWISLNLESKKGNHFNLSTEQIQFLEEEITKHFEKPEEVPWEEIKKNILQ